MFAALKIGTWKIFYSLSNIINPLYLQLCICINTHTYEHIDAHIPLFCTNWIKNPHVAATTDQEANDKEVKEETQAGIHTEWHLKKTTTVTFQLNAPFKSPVLSFNIDFRKMLLKKEAFD